MYCSADIQWLKYQKLQGWCNARWSEYHLFKLCLCSNAFICEHQDVRMAKMPPCDMLALTAWDQRYSTTLPDSIRDFYLARCHFRHWHNHWWHHFIIQHRLSDCPLVIVTHMNFGMRCMRWVIFFPQNFAHFFPQLLVYACRLLCIKRLFPISYSN